MMITEAAREAIGAELEQLNQGHWLQLESQVHYHGKEGNFWFLVPDGAIVPEVIDLVLGTFRQAAERFDETTFFFSLSEKTAVHQVIWGTVSHREILEGLMPRPLCKAPSLVPLGPCDVFGPNDGIR